MVIVVIALQDLLCGDDKFTTASKGVIHDALTAEMQAFMHRQALVNCHAMMLWFHFFQQGLSFCVSAMEEALIRVTM